MAANRLLSRFLFVCLLFSGSFLPAFSQVTVSVGDYLDLDPDEPVWVYVTVDGSTSLSGLSFSLAWDPTVACYTGLDLNFDLTLGTNNFNLLQTLNGQIGFSYFNLFGPVQPGDTLFAIQLTACGAPGSSTPITISDEPVVIDATGPFVPGGIPPQPVDVLPAAGGQVGFYSIAELPAPTLLLQAEGAECLQPGDTQWVCVTVDSVTNFSSLQFSLDWDTFELDLVELDFVQDLPGLNPANFNVDVGGELGFSWFGFSGSGLKPGDTLFCMQFVVEGPLGSEGIINVGDSPLEPAASGLLSGGVFPVLEVVPGVGEELTRIATDGSPTALCKDVTLELPFNGIMAINPDTLDNGSFDDCLLDTLFTIPDSLFMDDVGVQMVALVAVDSSGNTDTCFANVTVEIPVFPDPVANCKDITVALDSNGIVIVPADSVNDESFFTGMLILDLKPDSFSCNEIGDNNVLLGVVDAIGADTCEAVVTVVDDLPPTAVCTQGIDTIVLDSNGVVFVDANTYDEGSSDNCGVNLSLDRSELGCADAGLQMLTLIATDPSGNADSCQFSVFVQDTIAPMAICQDFTVYLDDQGQAQIDPSFADGGSSDNCGFTLSSIPGVVNCDDLGTSELTLTVIDDSGNSTTCSSSLTVEDTLAPVAICEDATVYLDEAGVGLLDALQLDGNSSDNCEYSVQTDLDSFSCADLGMTFITTLVVTDNSGNTDSCTSNVSVFDTLIPTAVCVQGIDTVTLDSNGMAFLDANAYDGGSSDNCGFNLSLERSELGCSDAGFLMVSLVVTDFSGNADSCQVSIFVQDTVIPVAICQDLTVYLDEQGLVQVDAALADGGSNDNCDLDLTSIPAQVDCSDLGTSDLILVATDNAGNSSTCLASLTVEDTLAPIAMCQDATIHLDENGSGLLAATELDGNSSDNCEYSVQTDLDSFSCADAGMTFIATLVVTDNSGNTDTCTSNVSVFDTLIPTAVCVQGIDTVTLDSNGFVSLDADAYDGGSTDNCSTILTLSQSQLVCSDAGLQTLSLFAADGSGNLDSCEIGIFVQDTIAPLAVCQDLTVYLDGQGQAQVDASLADGGSVDNCSLAFSSLPVQVGCADLGTSALTLIVTDDAGNSSTCQASMTVVDTVPPVAVCQDVTVYLNENGLGVLEATQLDGNSSDNCGFSVETDLDTFNCDDSGMAFTATLVVTDVSSATDTCTSTVMVLDTLDPTVLCKSDTVYLSSDGIAVIAPLDVDGGSVDNCAGIVELSLDKDTFSCGDLGAQNVILFGTDQSGNTDSCTAQVLVLDSIVPQALCENAQIFLDSSGTAVLSVEEINDGSTDNCGLNLSLSQSIYSCDDVGNSPVTLYVTDASNNTDSCTGIVIVEDTISPTIVCQDLVVNLDSAGNAQVDAGAFVEAQDDNCTIELSPASFAFDCDSTGTFLLEIIGTDPAGNTDTCVVQALVQDDSAPDMVCKDVTVQLTPSGTYTLMPAQVDGGSTDNCDLALEVNPDLLTTADIGVIGVTLTGTDPSGNTDSCLANVTVVPFGSGPTAICKDITAELTANGTVTVPASAVNDGSLGNGQLFFLLLPGATFNCSDIGPNDVMLVVQDNNGTDTCEAVITIEDNLPPAITCVDGTVILDENGQASANINDFLTMVADNCGLGSTSMTPLDFSCMDIGVDTAEIIAVDAGGNADTCYVAVTVQDTMVPVAQCDSISVDLGPDGTFVPDPTLLGASSTDNCTNLTFSLDRDTLGCNDLGDQVLELTVTDPDGNADVCLTLITVGDSQDPVALCQGYSLYLGSDGTGLLSPLDIDGGSTDNCPLDFSVSQESFSCADLGVSSVVLTVTDGAGNQDQCAADVEILDTLAPHAVCRDITVQLDAMNEVFITAPQVNDGSTDNCTIFSLELDTAFFDIDDVGPNPVVMTVTDQSGNSSSCSSTVTVVDFNTPAVARCKDVALSLDASGTAILSVDQINDGSTGAGALMFQVVPNVFNCEDIGLDTAFLIVSDENNTSDTCHSEVTILDNIAPTAQCTDVQVNLNANGIGIIEAADVNLGSSDNCEIVSMVLDTFIFNCDDIGENVVTLTVTDQSGNSSECSAVANVEDNIPPSITCKNVVINLQIAGLPADTLSISQLATATDNCSGLMVTASQLIFDCSDLGLNTVLMTAIDADGNSVVCQSTVTVRDIPLNNPLCKNTSVQLDDFGTGGIVAQDVLTTIPQGVCNPITVTISETSFNCSDLGLNTVVVNVNNGVDYDFSCSAQVTVVDQVDPVAECKDITISLNNSGVASITPTSVDDGSTDNCSVTNRLLSRSNFDCNDAGTVVPVNLTVTDQSGNSDVCTANVTVNGDNTIVAECKNVTVSLDINGSASITPQMIDDGSSVGCGTLMLSLSQTEFDCEDIGNQQVVLTVTNGFGGSETCSATVSVSDDLPPLLTCADVTLQLNLSGSTILDPTEAVDPFNTFDNCGDVQLLQVSPFSFDCADAGGPVPFALTAVDENGNTANCAGTVTVVAPLGLIPFLEFTVTPESAPGQMDGAVLVNVIGGSGAFEFAWSTGSSNNFINNLSGGEYCVTVTDLNTDCEVNQCVDVPVLSPTNISVSGIVETEEGSPVRSVNVRLFGAPNDSTLTPSAGTYSFDNLPSGGDWEVSPYKDINDKNGVTTFDLVLISQHILQVFSLNSPYKLIAADANSDQKISTLDILDLRLLILQIVDKLPNNTSWRFVDADYVFPKPDDPFIDTFPETVMLTDLTQSAKDVDFIGVKIGDVDLSADPLLFHGGPTTENRDGEDHKSAIEFSTDDLRLSAGEVIEVPVRASDFSSLLGYQMTIDFDPSQLIFQEIVPANSLDLTQEHFGYRYLEDGLISANWFSGFPHDLEEGAELFRLVFKVGQIGEERLSDVLRFSSGLVSSEAYRQGDAEPLRLLLRFEEKEGDSAGKQLHLYAPRPNPFRDQTILGFDLPEAKTVNVRFVDAAGRVVSEVAIDGIAGYNEIQIEGNQLPQPGLYFFQLITDSGTTTGRIMKID